MTGAAVLIGLSQVGLPGSAVRCFAILLWLALLAVAVLLHEEQAAVVGLHSFSTPARRTPHSTSPLLCNADSSLLTCTARR